MARRFRVGEHLECQVTGYSRRGDGRAQQGKWTVELPGTFVGERVRVRIAHIGKQSRRLFTEAMELQQEHDSRREVPCRHQRHCNGCPWMALDVAEQGRHKQQLLRDAYGLEVDELVQLPDGERGYRWSSKRVVGGRAGALILGSYRRGSHDIADMSGCQIDHPAIERCLAELLEVANACGIEPYQERTGEGELRYVWLKTNRGGEVLVTLVCAERGPKAAVLAAALKEPHGVFRCLQQGRGNALRGDGLEHLAGQENLSVTLADVEVTTGPLAFMQPNPAMAERCYRHLIDGLKGQVVYDLYAGLGITTCLLFRQFDLVLACDTQPGGRLVAMEPAQDGVQLPDDAQPLDIRESSVEQLLDRALGGELPPPDAVISNPPRAGFGERVCAQLNELCARQPFELRVMSCDPSSFTRDRERLAERFELAAVRAYDTLPQTVHVELVARLLPRG